ncbi:MAG TPA: helix-turn-helix domain-containing protein [Chloroflexota bacterium]|nr:helix-turn-helix domain-containing protein [Chloroflexota bacterium]
MAIEAKPSTIRALTELEQEMAEAKRTAEAEALREALAMLARPSRGWLSTGQAAEQLGVTIPTVKEWIRRGTLEGQPVGSRWRVSAASVEKVLQIRGILDEMDGEGRPPDDEIQEMTRDVRHRMRAEHGEPLG